MGFGDDPPDEITGATSLPWLSVGSIIILPPILVTQSCPDVILCSSLNTINPTLPLYALGKRSPLILNTEPITMLEIPSRVIVNSKGITALAPRFLFFNFSNCKVDVCNSFKDDFKSFTTSVESSTEPFSSAFIISK